MAYYDVNHDGYISYEEFVRGVREPMNERRTSMVQKIFKGMDKAGTGKVAVGEIEKAYSVEKNKEFLWKKKSREELFAEFLGNFQGAKEGTVAKQEFVDYYTDLSMSIASDEYFVQMLETVWHVAEKDGETTKTEVATLAGKMVEKLKELVAPPWDEGVMRNLFREFNKSRSGTVTIDEFEAMLGRLEVPAERRYITELFKKLDANKSGTIEFDEFCSFFTHSS